MSDSESVPRPRRRANVASSFSLRSSNIALKLNQAVPLRTPLERVPATHVAGSALNVWVPSCRIPPYMELSLHEGLESALASRYRLVRELGRGGMATVYLSDDLRHDRRVAVKVLHPELASSLGPDRFLREIKLAARLNHPHIVPLYDSGEASGFLYYVMPLVEGESLRDRLLRDGHISTEESLQIVRGIASALDYAHRQNIVHRDIKPENVMLQDGEALVTDFGIAKAVSVASGDTLTQTGMMVGTPAYVSPEQAAGEISIDGRSDQYSLACVLYEMLSGRKIGRASCRERV